MGQQGGDNNKELPEQGGSLDNRPLVEVRSGGVNMESDCSRQSAAPASTGGGGKGR
jgi:hypothetical protein